MSKKRNKRENDWNEAQRRCRLSAEDVRMAKELGFAPKALIRNIPSRSQPWKAPVRQWIRELHAKRFGPRRSPNAAEPAPPVPSDPGTDQSWPEDLIAQWDTVNEELYFVRASDGKVFTLEQAGDYQEDQSSDKAM